MYHPTLTEAAMTANQMMIQQLKELKKSYDGMGGALEDLNYWSAKEGTNKFLNKLNSWNSYTGKVEYRIVIGKKSFAKKKISLKVNRNNWRSSISRAVRGGDTGIVEVLKSVAGGKAYSSKLEAMINSGTVCLQELFPELENGKGDMAVSEDSAKLPGVKEHIIFRSHFEIHTTPQAANVVKMIAKKYK